MSDLPSGWRATTLGQLGQYLNGRGFKKSEWRDSGRPIIRIQNLTGSSDVFNYYDGEADERYTARAGDLLVSWAATLGAYIWPGPEAVVNQHIFKVESSINTKFHKYLLDHKLADLGRQTHGSGMVHITRGRFDALPVTVPCEKSEQRRIVDLLEDHLSRLDAAGEYAYTAAAKAKSWRLSAARRALPDNMPRHALGELLVRSIGGVWGLSPGVDEVEVDVIRVTELRPGGRIDQSTAAARSISTAQLASRDLREGDLLLEKSGGGPRQPVGRVGLIGKLPRTSVCSNFMQLLRPDISVVRPAYLHLYLNDLHERGGTERLQTASTNIRNIKASEYVKLLVPLPSLDEQDLIVATLTREAEAAGQITSTIRASAARGQSLRRALLSAAFSGRLTGRSSDMDTVEELAKTSAAP